MKCRWKMTGAFCVCPLVLLFAFFVTSIALLAHWFVDWFPRWTAKQCDLSHLTADAKATNWSLNSANVNTKARATEVGRWPKIGLLCRGLKMLSVVDLLRNPAWWSPCVPFCSVCLVSRSVIIISKFLPIWLRRLIRRWNIWGCFRVWWSWWQISTAVGSGQWC